MTWSPKAGVWPAVPRLAPCSQLETLRELKGTARPRDFRDARRTFLGHGTPALPLRRDNTNLTDSYACPTCISGWIPSLGLFPLQSRNSYSHLLQLPDSINREGCLIPSPQERKDQNITKAKLSKPWGLRAQETTPAWSLWASSQTHSLLQPLLSLVPLLWK